MEVDPNSLDPELRTARYLALAAAAFGLMSLCLAIIPACGGITSVLGILCGIVSMRTENSRTALVGVILSGLGVVITLVYALFVVFFRK